MSVYTVVPGTCDCLNIAWYVSGWPRCAGVFCGTPGADVHHAVVSMLLAVCKCLHALDVQGWPLTGGGTRTKLAADVDRAFRSMLLAVCGCHAALAVRGWPPHAEGLQAMLDADVDHANLRTLLAINRLLDALHIESRFRRT